MSKNSNSVKLNVENVLDSNQKITSLQVTFYVKKRTIKKVEDNGFEPLTPCVQGRCSSQLS